jgi:transcriptional regulator with XRE-family HTH domain
MHTFAENLAQLIRLRGWTQIEAAENLGVSQALISRYLRGKREPLPRTIAHLAERLGVDVTDLTGDRVTKSRGQRLVLKTTASERHRPGQLYVYDTAMKRLKIRWKKHPQERETIKHLVAALFRSDSERILLWLAEP